MMNMRAMFVVTLGVVFSWQGFVTAQTCDPACDDCTQCIGGACCPNPCGPNCCTVDQTCCDDVSGVCCGGTQPPECCDTGCCVVGLACPQAGLGFFFHDVTIERGICPVQPTPSAGYPYGPGVAAADFDGDGFVDFYIPQPLGVADLLYHNLGDGNFAEIAVEAGLAPETGPQPSANSGLWIDYDNDADLDLFVINLEASTDESLFRLYRNDYDTVCLQQSHPCFVEVTGTSGVETAAPSAGIPNLGGMCAGDINNDGFIDVYVGLECAIDGICTGLSGGAFLFVNNAGQFEQKIDTSGLDTLDTLARWQPIMADFNGDGWIDIYQNIDMTKYHTNALWLNETLPGDPLNPKFVFAFDAECPALGVLVDPDCLDDPTPDCECVGGNCCAHQDPGCPQIIRGGCTDMGIALGDFDNDADLDVSTATTGGAFLLQNGSGGGSCGAVGDANGAPLDIPDFVHQPSLLQGSSGWAYGTTFMDADNDGYQDLAVINFSIESPPTASALYHNQPAMGGGRELSEVAADVNFDDHDYGVSLVAFDFDRDGDLDTLQTGSPMTPTIAIGLIRLKENEQCNSNNWFVVKPRMPDGNRFAIGAVVRISTTGPPVMNQMRLITAGTSFWGQEPAESFFGLGPATVVDSVTVEWPGMGDQCEATKTTCTNIPINQVFTIINSNNADCNANGITDACEVATGAAADCDNDGLLDSCELDCNGNSIPDDCEPLVADRDCDGDGVCNGVEISGCSNTVACGDCNADGIPNECEGVATQDCDGDGVCNGVEISGCSDAVVCGDCDVDGVPNECETVAQQDCDGDAVCNSVEIAGIGDDCNSNQIPDECDLAAGGGSVDVDPADGIPDECEGPKNRYLSFAPVVGSNFAYELTMTVGPGVTGLLGFVDSPDLTNNLAGVVGTAVLKSDWPTAVHVSGCEIVPGAIYEIQAKDDQGVPQGSAITIDTAKKWGDIVADFIDGAWTPPVGTSEGGAGATNLLDALADVQRFQGLLTAPATMWADVAPVNEAPNNFVNLLDVQFIVLAFQGASYGGADPADCLPPGTPPPGTPVTLVLTATNSLVDPGEPVEIDVFVDSVTDLSGYQIKLAVSGGTGGAIVLTSVSVDDVRPDYVFASLSTLEAPHVAGGRLGNVLIGSGPGVDVTASKYLTTFSFLPCEGATGTFNFSLVTGGESFLTDSAAARIDVVAASCPVVGVGVDCLTDAHCDDNNDCTIDTCIANQCVLSFQTSGTSCDDGQFCTGGDTCDGSGTCVGGPPPCAKGMTCCELTDQCVSGSCFN